MTYTRPPIGDTNIKYSPVMFETPYSLTGCTLTDGRGLLMWVNGLNVRIAILPDPQSWLADDVVTAGMTSTVFTASGGASMYLSAAACYRVGSDVYATIQWAQLDAAGIGRVEIYKANSGSNPSSFSLHGTVQNMASDYSGGMHSSGQDQGQRTAGIPYVDGSTWTLHTSMWNTGGLIVSASARAGVFRSTDGGVNWTNVSSIGYGTANRFTDFVSSTIGVDTDTGYLYAMSGSNTSGSGADTSSWTRSTDGGVTWTFLELVGPGNYTLPYTYWGHRLFGLWSQYTVSVNSPDTNYNDRTVESSHVNAIHDRNAHICLGGAFLYFFENTTVQWSVANLGWRIGGVGPIW